MIRPLLLLPALMLATQPAPAGAIPSDPSIERAGDQHHTAPVRKRERAKPVPAAPCAGCSASPSAQPPMLEAPVPGLLLIPAEAAAI